MDEIMPVQLEREENAVWDEPKASLFGRPHLSERFAFGEIRPSDPLPPEQTWFKIKEDGEFRGYGWLIVNGDETEIEICVDEPRKGVGTAALSLLEEAASDAGASTLCAVIRPSNSEAEWMVPWLESHGYSTDPIEGGGFFLSKVAVVLQ